MTTLPPLQRAIRDLEYLEEMQGLTPNMIAAYLVAAGWVADASGYAYRHKDDPSNSPAYPSIVVPCLHVVARVKGISVQALVRKMNPRWMGLPTIEQWDKHGGSEGLWLAQWTRIQPKQSKVLHLTRPMISVTRLQRFELPNRSSFWAWACQGYAFTTDSDANPAEWDFWPVDDDGNRINIGALS